MARNYSALRGKRLYTQPRCPHCPEGRIVAKKQFGEVKEIFIDSPEKVEKALKEGILSTPTLVDEQGRKLFLKINKKGESLFD